MTGIPPFMQQALRKKRLFMVVFPIAGFAGSLILIMDTNSH
jgi:hypothetical protein